MTLLRKSIASAIVLAALATPVAAFAHGPGGGPGYRGGTGPGATGCPMDGCGWGMGPGMMGQGQMGQGQMMGPGMMQQPGMMGPGMQGGMMGPGQMMGPGMMQQPGMMGPGMQGGMMGPGMMGQGRMMGPGMMGPGGMAALPEDLTVENVRHMLEHQIAAQGNARLKLGTVEEKDADTITAEIVTQDGSLVQRLEVDRHTGWTQPVS